MKIQAYGKSDTGKVRQKNEDRFLILDLEAATLILVVDGMGGVVGGDVAADIIKETVQDFFEQKQNGTPMQMAPLAFQIANKNIREKSKEKPHLSGMGAVATACYFQGDKIFVAHVGDTRLYRLRHNRFEQLSEDQTYVNELRKKGIISKDEARQHPQKNVVLEAIGILLKVNPQKSSFTIKPSDRYLVCSDGLYDMIDDETIKNCLAQYSNPQKAVEQLTQLALDAGGLDNITTVVVGIV